MSFFGAYSARSVAIGIIPGILDCVFFLYLPNKVWEISIVFWFIGFSVLGSLFGKLVPIPIEDLKNGQLVGINWIHWLWLWLIWPWVVASAVSVGAAAFILQKPFGFSFLTEIFSAGLMVAFIAYATMKALRNLRDDAALSRFQSAIKVLFSFGIIPIGSSLWRFAISHIDELLG